MSRLAEVHASSPSQRLTVARVSSRQDAIEEIDAAIKAIGKRGFKVAGQVVGEPGTDLRQVFTEPEMKGGEVFTVLELIERHHGYEGFLPPQADGLMESTRR